MRYALLPVLIIGLLIIGESHLLAQGTSHLVYGEVLGSGGSPPDSLCLLFEAFTTRNPADILTQNSTGCGYSSGTWGVNTGNFINTVMTGDTLIINFIDTCRSEVGADTGIVDLASPSQNFGTTTLAFQACVNEIAKIPDTFELTLFPNPCNTRLNLLVRTSAKHTLKISVYNITGKVVSDLYNGKAGDKLLLIWDGKDMYGKALPSGLYFLKAEVGNLSYIKRFVYLR